MGIPDDIDIILGYGALAARQFWLDGPGNALYFSSTSHRMPAPASFNLMGGTFIQDSNGNGPMKAYVAEWSPAWDAGLRTGDVLISINGRKNPYPDLVEYVTTQRGAQASVVVQRRNRLVRIQWEVPAAPPAGDYYPTPQAITEQEFENHVRQQEKKNRPSPPQTASSLRLRPEKLRMKPLPQLTGKRTRPPLPEPGQQPAISPHRHEQRTTSKYPHFRRPRHSLPLPEENLLACPDRRIHSGDAGHCGLRHFEVVELLGFLEPVLLPILIAAVVAYLLEPIVSWLVRLKFSRPWAVVTVMFAALAVLVGFGATILPPLIRQTDELIDNRMELWDKTSELIDSTIEIPFISRTIDSVYSTSLRELNASHYTEAEVHDLRNARTAREKLGAYMTINSSFYQDKLMSWLTSGGRALYSTIGIMVSILITPIFAFYFLLEADKIKEKWPSILPLKVSKFRKDVVDTMEEINGYLISFFRGQMLVSIIEGILIAICLKLIGLPYAITIGAAVCVLGIIPYLGIITAFIPAVLLAWFTWGDFQHVLIVSGIFLAVNQFDGWIIQPKIVGDSVELHPLTVMFSVLIWTLILGGLIGALLAVPLTAAIKVLYKRYIWQNASMRPMTEPVLPPEHPGEQPPDTPEDSAHA